ncbi:MAG: Na+/H+ antiporter NhaC family protein [Fusobacteriaceae bacterium]|nr:Na+/H+ antiporter NhaC family protein [Fusobacteriaceae bacterium]MBN2839295.1 Na+/H+ antiporter NhaC family protein [Fusobacteriaceae bacterium]
MRKSRLFLLLFVCLSIFTFGADANPYVEKFKFFTLLPPLIAIILAFITKNVILSLIIGVLSGSMLINSGNVIKSFTDLCSRIIASMADSWNAGIILQVLVIGGLIAVITKMGGARAIAESLSKRAKTPASAQIIAWLMGLFIFFDDYANSLIVGPIMKPITDKMRISREKLAFIIDSTAAPVAGLALVSTWIGYEISLIKDGYSIIGDNSINAYGIFMETIPYRFYNILMLIFVVLSGYMLREFGPMYKAEKRARTTGKVTEVEVDEDSGDDMLKEKAGITPSIWDALIPILTLIIGALVGFYFNGLGTLEGETLNAVKTSPFSIYAIRETFGASDASVVLFEAALFASIIAIIMGVAKKIFSVTEALDTWIHGMKHLVITGVILLLAWSLSSVIKELGASTYLVSLLSNSVPKILLPSIIFILASIISFSTGTSYGTMGILMPLAIPLADAIAKVNGLEGASLHNYIVITVSAVLTGAIFGDHCSPISDTTILSSMGASCEHLAHTKTQIIYAISVASIAIIFGYLPTAMGINVWISLGIGSIAIWALIRFVGKSVKNLELEK